VYETLTQKSCKAYVKRQRRRTLDSDGPLALWRWQFGDLGVTELKRLKMLEDENARLKRIVADLTLDKQILQEVVRKKL
jgi:putative transposase